MPPLRSALCVRGASRSARLLVVAAACLRTSASPVVGAVAGEPLAAATTAPAVGVSFSPAGLLTPFHLGASAQLKSLGVLTPQCAVAGASGGALAAVLAALDSVEGFDPLAGSLYVAKQCRDHGPRATLRRALDRVLEDALPADAHEALNHRASPCTVAFASASLASGVSGHFVKQFSSRADVMDCLRASCNVPFYFDGNALGVSARGMQCIDGFFAVELSRFGCPPTGATAREIIVSPFRSSLVRLDPRKTRDPSSRLEFDVICPDLLDEAWWPFSALDVLAMALDAPGSSRAPHLPISDAELEDKYRTLYLAGQEAVRRWHATKSW